MQCERTLWPPIWPGHPLAFGERRNSGLVGGGQIEQCLQFLLPERSNSGFDVDAMSTQGANVGRLGSWS